MDKRSQNHEKFINGRKREAFAVVAISAQPKFFFNDARIGRPIGPRKLFPRRKSKLGQATIEYALLIGIAALIGLSFLSIFSGVVGEGMLSFNVILEQELMSGNFNEAATGWEN